MGLLAGTVIDLRARYPALEVRLVHGRQPYFRDQIASGELDAAIYVETPGAASSELEWTHLYSEPLMLVCSSSIATPASDVRRLLRSQPFIHFDRSGATSTKIDRILQSVAIQPNEVLEMNSLTGIVELIRQNAGISVLPVLRGFKWESDPALCLLTLPGRRFERRVGMLRNLRRTRITDLMQDELLRRLSA